MDYVELFKIQEQRQKSVQLKKNAFLDKMSISKETTSIIHVSIFF